MCHCEERFLATKQSLKTGLLRFARNDVIVVLMLLCLSGCAWFEHTDQLSVLGDYSRDKENQHRLVKSVNAHYDTLTRVIAQGHIREYKDKASWVTSFGAPILKKDLGHGVEQWLYRYAILSMAHDKVYAYFDNHDHLIKWEKVLCPSFF
jgi:hypothetical protein